MKLPNPLGSVVVRQEGEDFFLMDTDGGEVFQVNATAARIFALCRTGATYDAAVAELATLFGAKDQDAAILDDVRATVAQFHEMGLCDAP